MRRPAWPIENTYPSLATRKRLAAQNHELKAVRLRAESAELLRLWEDYRSKRDAQRAAERNVEQAAS